MSKCSRCKYEYSSKTEKPCKYCMERFGTLNIGYSMSSDNFQPKEEKSVIEHDGCKGCVYEHFEDYEEPCLLCKCTFKQGTPGYREAKDYFKPKKYSSDCTISCKEPNDSFKNEDYEFKEIDMVNHPPHYQHGIEPIEFIESHNLNFNLSSAVKYIARAPYKGKELEDLKKAKWFIEREIKRHDKQRI